jgi:hypothetical protein
MKPTEKMTRIMVLLPSINIDMFEEGGLIVLDENDVISEWNVPDITQPTEEELAAVNIEEFWSEFIPRSVKQTMQRLMILHTSIDINMFGGRGFGMSDGLIILDENDDISEWNVPDITQPTEEELAAVDISTMQAVLEPLQQRRKEYPHWRNQMEMIYKDMKDGTTTHKDTIDAIKTKYPKHTP